MSKREQCTRCLRAKTACLCHTITPLNSQLSLIILQHPSEVKHAKGTAKIVELSLSSCKIIVGEDFSDNADFNEILNASDKNTWLLYPANDAISVNELKQQLSVQTQQANLADVQVIVLDGSWKKAYKMYCLNPRLAALPCIGLDVSNESNYRIRKSSRSDSLSTLEACHALLTQFEGNQFDTLLDSFNYMVDFQLKAMPQDVQQRYRRHP
ncbi:MAG: DTW domain-containing protein [Psychrobium sp.]|nr:DTW domain-containing protein [Psychrobium sp.]